MLDAAAVPNISEVYNDLPTTLSPAALICEIAQQTWDRNLGDLTIVIPFRKPVTRCVYDLRGLQRPAQHTISHRTRLREHPPDLGSKLRRSRRRASFR